jgi:hypothetical protein
MEKNTLEYLLALKKSTITAEEMTANESIIIFSHGENDG